MIYVNGVFEWVKNNAEWVFSGVGATALGVLGKIIFKRKNESQDISQLEKKKIILSGNNNVSGDGNIVNFYNKELEIKEQSVEKTWFYGRFTAMLKLLNDTRDYNEKEYTVEYVSSLLKLNNVGELKQYIQENIEPDDSFKEKFVQIFGVNKEWMVYGQGEHPFATNIKGFNDNPMDILRYENLTKIESFTVVYGIYEGERHACIIRKTDKFCYEVYPSKYILFSDVGNTGKYKLVEFFRFIREAEHIKKLAGMVYEATEQQFLDLYNGNIAPKKVKKFEPSKWFVDKFLDTSSYSMEQNARFWDEDLIEVQKIIKRKVDDIDRINQESDEKMIAKNLEKNPLEEKEIVKESVNNANKIFISYSWTPESNKKWVEELVKKLEKDGVQVVIDFKELKVGHDKFAFMERIVNDTTIKKVLIICNKTYKEKADFRSGGVGDESAIITSQIYGNVRQEKFIPVVNEYDEQGKPYLPNYLASRMYIDLTVFDKGYKELLSNILGENQKETFEEKEELEETIKSSDIDNFNAPTSFFDYRFGKAFPGVRGLKEFNDSEECIERLEILLQQPLNKNKMNMSDPIWWLRGSSNNEIPSFERLDKTRILIDDKQLDVKKVIVYASPTYYKKFVYVETKPEEATGLYEKPSKEQIDYWVEHIGSYFEEYAVYKDKLIKRTEYDDGAAIIDGKVVDLENRAKIRTRYLTPYNFLICAKWNPLNETKYDSKVEKILYGILKGTHTIKDLTDFCNKLPRHHLDN